MITDQKFYNKKMKNDINITKKYSDINTHVVLVAGFVQKDDKFLIARRSKSDGQSGGKWSVPGGKVDMELGDGIIQKTLNREIKEEVGLEIEDHVDMLGNDSFVRSSGHHVVALIFLCRWKKGNARPLEDNDKVLWLTLNELINFRDADPYLRTRVSYLERFIKHTSVHKVIPRSLCFIFNEDAVLMLKASREKDWYGYLEPPGGHIEEGEGIIENSKKEIFEETGLRVKNTKLVGVIHVHNFYGKEIMLFVTSSISLTKKTTSSHEGEPVWIKLNSLKKVKIMEDIKPMIEKIIKLEKGEMFFGVSEFDGKDKLISFNVSSS